MTLPAIMSEASVYDRVRAYAAERRFRVATIERWTTLEVADAESLLDLAERLRLGENQLRDLWDWLEEVAIREGRSVADVLASGSLRDAFGSGLGRSDQHKRFKAALRRLRYPRLAAQEERIRGLVEQLSLPAAVRVEVPDFLEGDYVTVSADVKDAKSLRRIAEALAVAAESSECATIFRLLDGDEA